MWIDAGALYHQRTGIVLGKKVYLGSSGNETGKTFLMSSFSSFACPKEETRKGHPNQSWPCGLPLLLDEGGTRKNSGFALKQFPRLFRPRLRGAAGQMGGEETSRWHAAEHRRGCRGFALFEALAEFAKPRQHRGAQGIPPTAGQGTQGALSLVLFLWASKEMNILTSFCSPMNSRMKHKKGRSPVRRPAFLDLMVKGATQRSVIPYPDSPWRDMSSPSISPCWSILKPTVFSTTTQIRRVAEAARAMVTPMPRSCTCN